MSLRRSLPAVALLVLAACEPSIDQRALPTPVDAAVFDPTNNKIPLPNDLALASIPVAAVQAGCPGAVLPSAQAEFLCQFAKAGGFPNDQEVAITVDFNRTTFDAASHVATVAPVAIDLASVAAFGAATTANIAIFRKGAPAPVVPNFGSPADVDAASKGTLTLHNPVDATLSRRWPAGAQYVVAVRGGAKGVKTAAGGTIASASTMFVLLQSAIADKSLLLLENQGALPGTAAEKAAAAAQLEPIRVGIIKPALAALTASGAWPVEETISIQTFAIAPTPAAAPTVVEFDTSKGSLPLPNDLMRSSTTGLISGQSACAFVQGTWNPVTSTCSSPSSAGFAAMDGFSTTAMALAPVTVAVASGTTTALVDAGTVTAANVFLYKVNTAATPMTATRLTDLAGALGVGTPAAAAYVTEPTPIKLPCGSASGTCSPVVGLQPAVPAAVPSVGTFYLPPLESNTTYAVVITSRVKDAFGRPLGRSTVAKLILDVDKPLVAAGKSIVGGVDDETAAGLTAMKAALAPVLAGLPNLTDVAMAYTFKTQTVQAVSQGLAAAPYGAEQAATVAIFAPSTVVSFDPLAFAGIDPNNFPDVAEFVETTFPWLDAIDFTTGALNPNQAAWAVRSGAKGLTALVAVPKASAVSAVCPGTGGTLKCAPLVVFHHGLGGSRWQMLWLANQFAKSGFVVASADMRLHGSRAACTANADCADGGTCTPIGPAGIQGDVTPMGFCSTAPLFDPTNLTTATSGDFFISGNFFRIRDTLRADVLDNSALVLALARPPGGAGGYPFQPTADPFKTRLAGLDGVVVDPTQVYYIGQSLGGIAGTQILATNPRYARGVLNVPGGTLVDVFTNAPDFAAEVNALFASLIPGYTPAAVNPTSGSFNPAVAAAYLKLLQVAKLTLDPGDPINYAAHVKTKLPSPLAANFNGTPIFYPTTEAFGQMALNDTTVPNPFNALLFNLTGTPTIPFTLYSSASAPGNSVDHGFLLETIGFTGAKAAGALTCQIDATTFLSDGTTVPAPAVALP